MRTLLMSANEKIALVPFDAVRALDRFTKTA